ncbi:MAG: ABC transporter ATP-binding protein, partial [Halioglobus sp.]|nr:ABC transporter ATP-binding protein [Halioglobus sp.]
MSIEILIDGLVKHFGDTTALDGISARIRGGRLTGIVGPDGAGKTTLMRCLAALMLPSEGLISVCGLDVATRGAAIHEITGYMPQRFGLYEDLTVRENMALYADLRGLDAGPGGELFARLLGFTGLAPFSKRLAGALSGGMKQKLGLACALMARPKVLLLDEPSVGVDPVSRQDLWYMVQELVAEGMAVVWSTAYLDEAESCQEVLLLSAGKIVFDGPPQDLTSRLRDRSYLMRDIRGNRRLALTEGLQLPGVRDGVIQGASVRLVLAQGAGIEQITGLAQA